MSGSIMASTSQARSSTGRPLRLRLAWIWANTSSMISCSLHSRAGLRTTSVPGASQSKMMTSKTSRVRPSPYLLRSMLGQNCACETEVRAHAVSS